jgi:hypothetical protein
MVMVREVLEGIVSPTVATSLIYEALEAAGGPPPRSLEEMRAFAHGPLGDAIQRRVRPDDASEMRSLVGRLFSRAIEGDGVAVDVDVDLGGESEDGTETTQMVVVQKPVPVVVLSASGAFAERLVLCLGEDRVRAVPVIDDVGLQKQVFAYSALLVVIDGMAPTTCAPSLVAATLRRLPDSATIVLWAAEVPWSQGARAELESTGRAVVTLHRGEGIEPLLDLVLSHFSEG